MLIKKKTICHFAAGFAHGVSTSYEDSSSKRLSNDDEVVQQQQQQHNPTENRTDSGDNPKGSSNSSWEDEQPVYVIEFESEFEGTKQEEDVLTNRRGRDNTISKHFYF